MPHTCVHTCKTLTQIQNRLTRTQDSQRILTRMYMSESMSLPLLAALAPCVSPPLAQRVDRLSQEQPPRILRNGCRGQRLLTTQTVSDSMQRNVCNKQETINNKQVQRPENSLPVGDGQVGSEAQLFAAPEVHKHFWGLIVLSVNTDKKINPQR